MTMALAKRVGSLEHRGGNTLMRLVPAAEPVPPVPLDGPADVLAVLAEQVNAVRADPGADPVERARTLGFLAGVALRAMEAKDLAARLEAVERVLKLRKDGQQSDQNRRR